MLKRKERKERKNVTPSGVKTHATQFTVILGYLNTLQSDNSA
jgi:hypothetical protein